MNSTKYLPLVSSPSGHDEISRYKRRERIFIIVIIVQTFTLIVSLLYKPHDTTVIAQVWPFNDKPLLYSPAQSIIEHEVKSFTSGHEHKTRWQGYGPDVDSAWGELYNHTIMKIPKRDAVLLPNKTYPIKDLPGYYLAGLDVFHQLHCLNNIRRALNREHYPHDKDLDEDHVSHCVDTVRQSLMCSADISVNVWQWSDLHSAVVGYSTQAHSCRKFDKVREFALSQRVHQWINTTLYVDDELPDPPSY